MKAKNRFRLLVSYKGTNYQGWQKQKHTKKTIQSQLEQALKKLFQEEISIFGAGRTDTGTHALGQSLHLDLPTLKPAFPLKKALNAALPEDIRVKKVWRAPAEFHALKSAVKKNYVYLIWNKPDFCVFKKNLMHWEPRPLDLNTLNGMSACLLGSKDFKSFQNSGTDIKSTVRTIYRAEWKYLKTGSLAFYISANGFLKQMIRNIVGAELELALQSSSISVKKFKNILLARDRRQALKTAPAGGLYLHKVFYPSALDKKCQAL